MSASTRLSAAKPRSEDPQVDERLVLAQLTRDEERQQHDAHREAAPGACVAPAPRARLLQSEDDEAHPAAEQDGAARVDAGRVALLGDARASDEDEGEDRHRHVDPEDRAPRPLREVATGERPDRGHRAREREEDRQLAPPLADVVHRDDDGQRGRKEERRERALRDAEDDDPRLSDGAGRRRPAERGRDREADDPDND
jgi:hypothetical protein